MASICAASLALHDCGVPLRAPVAGSSIGLSGSTLLTDPTGTEDHFGSMDCKVAGTERGVTAAQVDVKGAGVSLEVLGEAFGRATTARREILGHMDSCVLNGDREPRRPRSPPGSPGVDALLQAGLVDGELHGEVDRVRQRSASGNFFREARGAARLSNVKLVLGPDRARAKDLDLNRLELGDCLVVLGREADDFLYSQSTQQRILGESGCTVQLDFVFEDRDDPAYFPQTYTFETSLSARHLNVDGDGEPVREDDYKFVVADVNHVLQGNAYWATARDYAPGLRGILNALG